MLSGSNIIHLCRVPPFKLKLLKMFKLDILNHFRKEGFHVTLGCWEVVRDRENQC